MSMVQQTMSQTDGVVTISETWPEGVLWELVYTKDSDCALEIWCNGERRELASIAEIYGALRNYR